MTRKLKASFNIFANLTEKSITFVGTSCSLKEYTLEQKNDFGGYVLF